VSVYYIKRKKKNLGKCEIEKRRNHPYLRKKGKERTAINKKEEKSTGQGAKVSRQTRKKRGGGHNLRRHHSTDGMAASTATA